MFNMAKNGNDKGKQDKPDRSGPGAGPGAGQRDRGKDPSPKPSDGPKQPNDPRRPWFFIKPIMLGPSAPFFLP